MKIRNVYMGIAVLATILMLFAFVSAHEVTSLPMKDISSRGGTHHLEVKPESLEGYRIPYIKVVATIIDQESQKTKTVELHPMFGGNFHYGVNVALEPKQYLLRFHLDPPSFMRGEKRMNQWVSAIDAEFLFDGAAQFEKSIKIGEKMTPDMKISFEAEHVEKMFVSAGSEKEHMAHEELGAPKESENLSQQFRKFLPFEHLAESHWFAVVLSILLWASLIYTAYALIQKFRKTSQHE